MEYDNSNRGALWKNENRVKDTQPQLKGTTNVTCPHCSQSSEFWTSAWTSNEGGKKPVVSISLTAKDAAVTPAAPAVVSTEVDFDEDLPF